MTDEKYRGVNYRRELSALRARIAELEAQNAEMREDLNLLNEIPGLRKRIAELEAEAAAHPVHEACPKCLANREWLRKRAERAERRIAELEQAVREEREACARVAEDFEPEHCGAYELCKRIAAAIRARKEAK